MSQRDQFHQHIPREDSHESADFNRLLGPALPTPTNPVFHLNLLERAVENSLNSETKLQIRQKINLARSSVVKDVPNLLNYPQLLDGMTEHVLKLNKEPKQRASALTLVFTDIEGTLLASSLLSEEKQAEALVDAARLVQFCGENGILLIPISGSGYEYRYGSAPSIAERLDEGSLPSGFPALITGGGKRAYGLNRDGKYIEDPIYQGYIKELEDKFDGTEILTRCKRYMKSLNEGFLDNKLSALNYELIARIEGEEVQSTSSRVFLQPHHHNTEQQENVKGVHMYFYANSLEERDTIEHYFRRSFSEPHMCVVCCSENNYSDRLGSHIKLVGDGNLYDDSVYPKKYCIDITPYDKRSAITYFSTMVKTSYPIIKGRVLSNGGSRQQAAFDVWYCGDGGNDIPAARSEEVNKVVMVGGSSREFLRHWEEFDGPERGRSVYVDDSGKLAAASIFAALQEAQSSRS